jgi:hypothetical protein
MTNFEQWEPNQYIKNYPSDDNMQLITVWIAVPNHQSQLYLVSAINQERSGEMLNWSKSNQSTRCVYAAAAGDEAVHNLKERTIQLQTNSLSQKNQPAIESKGTTGAE